MDKNKILLAVIIILLLIGTLFLLTQSSARKISQRALAQAKEQSASAEVKQLIVEVKKAKIEAKEEPRKEPAKKPEEPKIQERKKVFLGNRGYVIKDGKSTYIKSSIFEEIRKNQYCGYPQEG